MFALHGFLGEPSDWAFLPDALSIDLTAISSPSKGFWKWASSFNQMAFKVDAPRILIGYSLGGRLAMHALLENPSLWQGAVLISAHPGLSSPETKKQRLMQDLAWADRFKTEPWEKVMQAWNAQDVFVGDTVPIERLEKNYNRNQLSEMLRHWSLGHQEDLISRLQALPIPILWVAGQKDTRYVQLYQNYFKPLQTWVAPDVSHRVPWQGNAAFMRRLEEFRLKTHIGA